jgi:hypothetical protein
MNRTALWAVPVLGTALAAGFQSAGNDSKKSWVASDGRKIEFVAACSYTESGIRCRLENGDADKALEARLETYFKTDANALLSFEYGRKNRLLVLRAPRDTWIIVKDPSRHPERTYLVKEGDGPDLIVVPVDVDKDASEASLTFLVSDTKEKPVDLPLKKSRKVTVGGATIEFVDDGAQELSPNDPFAGFYSVEGKWCSITFASSVLETDYPPFIMMPLDSRKEPIDYVDRLGKPVETKLGKRLAESGGFDGRIKWFWHRPYPGLAEVYRAFYSTAPQSIAFLRVSRTNFKTVTFSELPLDAKP